MPLLRTMKRIARSAPCHQSTPSVDTNASAIAESTISIGQIAKFPEPPSSIPNSPAASTFAATARQLPRPQAPAPHPRKLPHPPPTSLFHHDHVDPSHSFIQPSSNPQTTSNSIVSAHDWHDGASSIDVNTVLPNALPTSFITALLQENKIKRKSTTSLALSGISETLYSRNSPSQGGQLDSNSGPGSPTPALLLSYDSNSVGTISGTTTKSFASSKTLRSSGVLLERRPDFADEDLDSGVHQPHCVLSQDPTPSRQPFSGSRTQCGSVSAPSSKSFLSRMSRRLSQHHLFARKTKPLPPIPILPNISLAQQRTQHESEMSSALPDLINRASTLRKMLENGQRPHSSSIGSFEVVSLRNTTRIISDAQDKHNAETVTSGNSSSTWYRKFQRTYASRTWIPDTKRKRIAIACTLICFLIGGLVLGLVLRLRKPAQTSCPKGKVGSKCNINANCVCTSSTTQCNGLAQAVMDLLPFADSLFKANYTAALAYSSFWLMEGGSQDNNCTAQAVMLDAGHSLDQATFPNRTRWAQTALLWNALKTQDLVTALHLQQFVQSLPWDALNASDGPVNYAEPAVFSITTSGFTFNFASQTVTQPPGTFVTLAHPSDAQIQKLSPMALAALDRMYTYAQASSRQQQGALQKYWTSVLLQRADTLPIFKNAVSVSPLMLPFNASSRTIRDLYPSTSSPFPPPLACFPYVDPAFQQQVSMFETTIFGLPTIRSNQTGFHTSCYRDRPIYGVLDILQMRLPFHDDIPSVTQHAAVLTRDLNSRIVFSVGKGFSGIFNGTVSLTPSQLDPKQYGTVNFLDHVILQYLTSIGDINVANSLIKFILDSSTAGPAVPPDPSSALFRAMKTVRSIEVAIFGDVTPSDFSLIVSPFAIESGALFFGTDDGAVLRNWTIGTAHLPIVWTQDSSSSLVVRDNSLGDNPVTRTWNTVSLALSSMTNIGVVNISNALMGTS